MQPPSTPRIRIDDLPPLELLTEEEMAHTFGAGRPRFRPTLESLEERLVLSPISDKYNALGGAQGFLGAAVTGELPTPYGNGLYQEYQNGAILWSANTGAHDIYGPI